MFELRWQGAAGRLGDKVGGAELDRTKVEAGVGRLVSHPPLSRNGMRKDLTIKNIKHFLYHLLQQVHIRALFQRGPRDAPAASFAALHLFRVSCFWILP